MGNAYIDSNVTKILESKDFDYPLNVAMAATWIIGNVKGFNLKILDMNEISSLADYFVLASTDNTIQAQAIADEVASQLRKNQREVKSIEGRDNSDWILIDAGDVIINLFQETSREVFNLDSLWKDAPIIKIPQSYYYSSDETNTSEDSDSKTSSDSYF